MSKKCQKFELLFHEYINNETKISDKIKLEAHLKECHKCNIEFQEITEVDEILKQIYNTDAISIDMDRNWKEIDARMDWGPPFLERIKNKIFRPIVWVPAICTAAIAIFIITILPMQTGTNQMIISSVVEVSSTSGSTMVLKTAKSGTPLIMFFPDTEKEAG